MKWREISGFSLVEFAIVLAIMGVVLGGLWSVVSAVRENVRRKTLADEVLLSINNIRDFYMSRIKIANAADQYDPVNLTTFLLKQGLLPPEMIRDRTAAGNWYADHPWGSVAASGDPLPEGGVAVSGRDVTGAYDPENFFHVEIRGLRYDSCVGLVTDLTESSMPEGLEGVEINGALFGADVSPDAAAVNCEEPSGLSNIIGLTYDLRKSPD